MSFRKRGNILAMVICFAIMTIISACGTKDKVVESTTPAASTAATETAAASAAPAAEGDTIPVGVLHSLTGTMSISEVAVKEAELMAIDEINAAGGVLGKQIKPIIEDGASDWPNFAEKAKKLLQQDKVATIFGGWTSSSRKAMLPVVEANKGLLWYPVQYEGLESHRNFLHRCYYKPTNHPCQ